MSSNSKNPFKENQVKIKSLDLLNIKHDEEGYLKVEQGTNIKEEIVCIRPGHKSGIPKVYAEFKKGKYISHDYGHSGIGYSIMFGTIKQSIENLINLKKDFTQNKNSEITVIGLGCIGLYTALKLFHLGYKNIKLIGEEFNKTASQWAGGLFEFSLTTVIKKENINYMNDIFLESFNEYKKIIEKKHEIISDGVKYVDYFTDFYEEGMGLSYLANEGLIPPIKKIKLQIETNKNLNMDLYHIKTIHIVTSIFMNNMLDRVKEYKIPIENKKINNFDEIKSGIIFNCTGLGSKHLNNDKDLYPVCGHGFVFNDKKYSEYDYILRLSKIPNLENNLIDGGLYFMPKISGFIGGTYLKDYDGKDEEYNKMHITNLMERARYLYYGIIGEEKKYLKKFSMKPKF